jgi:hypothetical protein
MNIKDFTAAQSLMLLNPKASEKDLIKYTFLDLIFKGILNVEQVWRKPNPRDPRPIRYTYVSLGESYNPLKIKYHQEPFIDFFEDVEKAQMLELIRYVFNEDDLGFKVSRMYIELRNSGFLYSILGLEKSHIIWLTKMGKRISKQIDNEIFSADEILPKLISTDKEKAQEILDNLGPNVLLLDCYDENTIPGLEGKIESLDIEFTSGFTGYTPRGII